MKKQLIRTTALVLAVITMLCPLCVCFAETDSISGFPMSDIAIQMYASLAASGIRIQGSQHDVIDWLMDQITEWTEDATSGWSWDDILRKWESGTDKLGHWLFGGYTIDIINKFGNWIKTKFNLGNNGQYNIVTAGQYVGDYIVYDLPILITLPSQPKRHTEFSYYIPSDGVYAVWVYTTGNYAKPYFFSYEPASIRKVYVNSSGVTTTDQILSLSQTNDGYYWLNPDNTTGWDVTSGWYIPYVIYNASEMSDIRAAIADGVQQTSGNIGIGTDIITLPYDDPYYTQGDGGYMDVYAPWGSNLEEILESIIENWDDIASGDLLLRILFEALDAIGDKLKSQTIDNLPAIISPQSITPLEVNSVFAPIKAFANTFSDGFSLMVQIMYNMPTAIVSIALSIMAAIAVFGTIKIFKEH